MPLMRRPAGDRFGGSEGYLTSATHMIKVFNAHAAPVFSSSPALGHRLENYVVPMQSGRALCAFSISTTSVWHAGGGYRCYHDLAVGGDSQNGFLRPILTL